MKCTFFSLLISMVLCSCIDHNDPARTGFAGFIYTSNNASTGNGIIALIEESGSSYRVPSSVGKTKEQHAYLGLTGFEK